MIQDQCYQMDSAQMTNFYHSFQLLDSLQKKKKKKKKH